MKILIISTLYPPNVIGGAEKAAAELAEALVRRGHVVTVVTLHPGSSEVVEDRSGLRIYRLPLDNFYWPFGRSEKPEYLRSSRLAHSGNVEPGGGSPDWQDFGCRDAGRG